MFAKTFFLVAFFAVALARPVRLYRGLSTDNQQQTAATVAPKPPGVNVSIGSFGSGSDDDSGSWYGSHYGSYSGSGSGSFEEDSPEAYCHEAITKWQKSCPGVAKFDDGQMSPSVFKSVCPCFGDAYEDEQLEILIFCDSHISVSLLEFEVLFCQQDTKQTHFCGEEFPQMNSTLQAIFGGSDPKPERATQAQLKTLCTECFDITVSGVFVILGELAANADGAFCDDECEKEQKEAADTLEMFTMASVMCIPNDNPDQLLADPFCLPYVMSRLTQLTTNCGSFKSEETCESNNGECAWASSTCLSVLEAPAGYMIVPPYRFIDDFCSNSCYFTMQFAQIAAEESQDEISSFGEDDARRRRVRRNKRRMNRYRKHRAMRKLQAAPDASEEVLNEAEEALASVVEYICLSNSKGNCLKQLNSLNSAPAGCETDGKTFNDENVTCSAACAAGMKAVADSLGCCYSTMQELQEDVDPDYYDFINFGGVAAACKFTPVAECNPYASTPQPVSTEVSGTCAWLMSNATNKEVLKNGTAKALGVAPNSLQAFDVKDDTGKTCSTKSVERQHRRSRALQAKAPGLKAGFNVVARDDATAKRIAANGNSDKPIAIPAVQQAAAKTATTAKNQEIAKSAPTVAPKAVNGTAAPTTKAPTSTPSGTQPIAPPTATGSAMSSLVSLMCALVVLAIMLI
eukprot:PhF_6_TR34161/c2_g1_i1/m.49944